MISLGYILKSVPSAASRCAIPLEAMSFAPVLASSVLKAPSATVVDEDAQTKGGKTGMGRRKRSAKTSTAKPNPAASNVSRSFIATRGGVTLDPNDPGIEQAIQRLERKSFIKDGIIPEIQCLLRVPNREAKQAYLQALAQYGLVCMLILASLLGSALNPLEAHTFPEANPDVVAAYNMLSMIICCACLFGTCVFLLEGIIMEGTPEHRLHSIAAKANPLFHFGTSMVGIGIQTTLPLILLRAWISGLNTIQCIILTIICIAMYFRMSFVYFRHLQTHFPVEAQRWTKLFFWPLYRQEKSHAAIDELVAELRYLQQPREKTLSAAQLGECLGAYFEGSAKSEGTWNFMAFHQLVEEKVGGRLAPTAEMLAKVAFEKKLHSQIETLANDAVSISNDRS